MVSEPIPRHPLAPTGNTPSYKIRVFYISCAIKIACHFIVFELLYDCVTLSFKDVSVPPLVSHKVFLFPSLSLTLSLFSFHPSFLLNDI